MKTVIGTNIVATDRWLEEIRRGRAFSSGGSIGPIAGNYSQHQILNPAGSGVNALLHQIDANSSGNDSPDLRTYNTALTTLIRQGANLLIGGTAALCAHRVNTDPLQSGTQVSNYFLAANVPRLLVGHWYAELGPGEGLVLGANTPNLVMYGNFMWIEIPL